MDMDTTRFLSSIIPFSTLPQDEIEEICTHLTRKDFPEGAVLTAQEKTRIQALYILRSGLLEAYFEDRGEKILTIPILPGDTYGGISILKHKGISIRTVRVKEPASLYLLPKDRFLKICSDHPSFLNHFVDVFGKRMVDEAYASIIVRSLNPGGDSIQFFDQTVGTLSGRSPLSCDMHTSIQQAASEMTRHRCSSILVRDPEGRHMGLVTDHDLRQKVIAAGLDIRRPVSDIMSYPLKTVSSQSLVFEALMAMMHANVKHLAVTDESGRVVGMITSRDMIDAQTRSPLFLIREIISAGTPDEILEKSVQLPRLIQSLMQSGAKAKNITRLVTTVSDTILDRIIEFTVKDMGPPPARFVFMVLGSEGRREQTLKTDQDNAIVFEDMEGKEDRKKADEYFLALGETVCSWLDRAGYSFCKGGVMAKTPRWCQPLSVWKDYFRSWIHAAEPKDLLDSSIFFDFRGGYGDQGLIRELRQYLLDSLTIWSGFFRHLMENALSFKPPLGFFGNFVVETKGAHRDALDLKAAMMPIVDIARIYALKNRIEETNTMERLDRLYQAGVFTRETFYDLDLAYGFLMQMRFSRQVAAVLEENAPPDNYINPKKLSPVEQTMLKEIFKRIEKYQTRLSARPAGSPL